MPGPSYTSIISAGMALGFSAIAILPRPLRASILKSELSHANAGGLVSDDFEFQAQYLVYGRGPILFPGSAGYVSVFSTTGVLTVMTSIRFLSQRFIMLGRNLRVLHP